MKGICGNIPENKKGKNDIRFSPKSFLRHKKRGQKKVNKISCKKQKREKENKLL